MTVEDKFVWTKRRLAALDARPTRPNIPSAELLAWTRRDSVIASRHILHPKAVAGIVVALFVASAFSVAADARGSIVAPPESGILCEKAFVPASHGPTCTLQRATPIFQKKNERVRGVPGDIEPEPVDECARPWAGNTRGKPATRPSCRH